MRRRQLEMEARIRERRAREDSAPRLRAEVANLVSLSIEIDDQFGSHSQAKTRYVRHVVVERAAALFEIPCSDPACEDGGHYLTARVMRALLAGATDFSGEDECGGSVGGDQCTRVLRFTGHATYLRDTATPHTATPAGGSRATATPTSSSHAVTNGTSKPSRPGKQ